MAPLPPVPGALKVTLVWGLASGIAPETILHFGYTGGPPSTSDCVALAASIQAAAAANIKTVLHTSQQLTTVNVLDLSSATGAEGQVSNTFVGTRAGTENFANVCVNIAGQIARRYRGGKPRSFPPFGVQGDLASPKAWTTALQTAVNTNWANFITAVAALTQGTTVLTHQINISYYQGYGTAVTHPSGRVTQPLKLRTTPVVDQIVSNQMSIRPGSQRKRLVKN